MKILLIIIGAVFTAFFLVLVFSACTISQKADYWNDKEFPESGDARTKKK